MANCGIHYFVNRGKEEGIHWVSVIEVRVIDAHMSFAILLRDNHDIGQPLEVLNLSNEVSSKEFVHFLFYDLLVCWVKLPQFLTCRLIGVLRDCV